MFSKIKKALILLLVIPLLASCSWEDSSIRRGIDSFTGKTQSDFSEADSKYVNNLNHIINNAKIGELEPIVKNKSTINNYGKRMKRTSKELHKATERYKKDVDYKALDKDSKDLYKVLVNTGEIYEITTDNLYKVSTFENINKDTFVKHTLNTLITSYTLLGNQYRSFGKIPNETKKRALAISEQNLVLDLTYSSDSNVEELAYQVGETVGEGDVIPEGERANIPYSTPEELDKYKPVGAESRKKAGDYNKIVKKYNKEVDSDMKEYETTERVSRYTYNLLITRYNGIISSYNDKHEEKKI